MVVEQVVIDVIVVSQQAFQLYPLLWEVEERLRQELIKMVLQVQIQFFQQLLPLEADVEEVKAQEVQYLEQQEVLVEEQPIMVVLEEQEILHVSVPLKESLAVI